MPADRRRNPDKKKKTFEEESVELPAIIVALLIGRVKKCLHNLWESPSPQSSLWVSISEKSVQIRSTMSPEVIFYFIETF